MTNEEFLEKARQAVKDVEAHILYLEVENKWLKAKVKEWKAKAQANWDLVETVALGEKLQCAKCGQYHPCRCDDGQ